MDKAEIIQNGGQEDDSYREKDEKDIKPEPCPCLFCKSEQSSAGATLDHCRDEHQVNLPLIAAQLGLDHYSCIKLINYIRKESVPPSFFSPLPQPPYPWDNDSYLQPVLEQDPLLLVDWESETKGASNSVNTHPQWDAIKGKDEEEEQLEEYFSTYSHFSIHLKMLSDSNRTESYRKFISKNPTLFKDKVVLDVGCGTGILSLFAAQAGAKLVIGVDQSFMLYNAMQNIRENGYEDKIKLIKGKLEEVDLPVDKVDVIISEWMGHFLLFESMLDTVIFSRDKWLRDPAHVYPNVANIKLVAVNDATERETRIDFWDNVYGFKMSCMKREVLREAVVQCMDESAIISSTHTLKEFDLTRVAVTELQFEEPFQLTIEQDSLCHAILGFFEAGFEGPTHCEVLKTGPRSPPTHWRQTAFYLEDPIPVHTGDVLEGRMSVMRSKKNPRALDLCLSLTLSPLTRTTKTFSFTSKYFLRWQPAI